VLQLLHSKCESLSSNPSTATKGKYFTNPEKRKLFSDSASQLGLRKGKYLFYALLHWDKELSKCDV
jgi:hypothetical protein